MQNMINLQPTNANNLNIINYPFTRLEDRQIVQFFSIDSLKKSFLEAFSSRRLITSGYIFFIYMLITLIGCNSACATDYPIFPIRIISPAPPGGGTDLVLRTFSDKLSQKWGKSVQIENRPGGDAIIASSAVAKAKPDGYTLLGTFDSHASNPAFKDSLPYDTINDFIPVTMLASVNMIIMVHPSLQVKTIQDLIAYSKQKPGLLTFSSIGVGSTQYMIGELFNMQTGAGMRHIAYKDRSQMTLDALAGRVSVIISNIGAMLPYIKSGALHPLAVTSSLRSSAVPDVPTVNESGISSFKFQAWVGLFAPARTPKDIIEKLHLEAKRISLLPDVRKQIEDSGAEVNLSASPEEFDLMVRGDIDRFTKIFKK